VVQWFGIGGLPRAHNVLHCINAALQFFRWALVILKATVIVSILVCNLSFVFPFFFLVFVAIFISAA